MVRIALVVAGRILRQVPEWSDFPGEARPRGDPARGDAEEFVTADDDRITGPILDRLHWWWSYLMPPA